MLSANIYVACIEAVITVPTYEKNSYQVGIFQSGTPLFG